MTKKAVATRRSFIRRTGAALSVPLAAAAATVPMGAAPDDPAARLARLEDVEAIRALNQALARRINAGDAEAIGVDRGIRSVHADGFGERDAIEIAPDRLTAAGLMHGTVEIETAIGPSCPLVEMAREQGGGVVRRSDAGVFEIEYARRDGTWSVRRAVFRARS